MVNFVANETPPPPADDHTLTFEQQLAKLDALLANIDTSANSAAPGAEEMARAGSAITDPADDGETTELATLNYYLHSPYYDFSLAGFISTHDLGRISIKVPAAMLDEVTHKLTGQLPLTPAEYMFVESTQYYLDLLQDMLMKSDIIPDELFAVGPSALEQKIVEETHSRFVIAGANHANHETKNPYILTLHVEVSKDLKAGTERFNDTMLGLMRLFGVDALYYRHENVAALDIDPEGPSYAYESRGRRGRKKSARLTGEIMPADNPEVFRLLQRSDLPPQPSGNVTLMAERPVHAQNLLSYFQPET